MNMYMTRCVMRPIDEFSNVFKLMEILCANT